MAKVKQWKWLLAGLVVLVLACITMGLIFHGKKTEIYEKSEEVFGNPLMGYAP